MSHVETNVGRFDALARRVAGSFAVLGGLVSLDGFFSGFGFLTWVVLAIMADAGLFFGMPGLKGGTLLSGALLGILAVLDGWLALVHLGQWALLIGVIVGAAEFITAGKRWGPFNALLGRDTRAADREWTLPPLPHAH